MNTAKATHSQPSATSDPARTARRKAATSAGEQEDEPDDTEIGKRLDDPVLHAPLVRTRGEGLDRLVGKRRCAAARWGVNAAGCADSCQPAPTIGWSSQIFTPM